MRRTVLGVCSSWASVLVACDPAGVWPAGVPPGAEVVATSPDDGALGVEPYAVVRAILSRDVEPATVDTTSFVVTLDGEPRAGRVTYDAATRTATFEPHAQLAPGSYLATVTEAMTDLDGMEATAHAWAFTVRDRAWARPIQRVGGSTWPRVGFDAAGHAIAVFAGVSAARYHLFDHQWELPEVIGAMDPPLDVRPRIAVDAGGDAVAVWSDATSGPGTLWTNHYQVAAGWRGATAIGTGFDPQVAVDRAGNAIVIWSECEAPPDGRYEIRASRYQPGTGWSPPSSLDVDAAADTELAGHAYQPRIAIDGRGNALAVWTQLDGAGSDIWANHFVLAQGWGEPERIELAPGVARNPQLAVGLAGHAVVVWSHADGPAFHIAANHHTVGAGWGVSSVIDHDARGASRPQVAVDAAGNAIAVWDQLDRSAWASRYVIGEGWTDTIALASSVTGGAAPQVATAATGDTFVVWEEQGLHTSVIHARRHDGAVWEPATMLHGVALCLMPVTGTSRNLPCTGWPAGNAQVAVDLAGNAVVVWQQSNGIRATSFR